MRALNLLNMNKVLKELQEHLKEKGIFTFVISWLGSWRQVICFEDLQSSMMMLL